MLDLPAEEATELVAALRAAGCVFAEAEAELLWTAATDRRGLADLLRQRVAGLPLESVVGWAEFAGQRVLIDPGVFVPRRRTELMVYQAVALRAADDGSRTVVLDLCCGSGAIGLAVATGLGPETVQLVATDIDDAAVRCARRNLEPIGGRVYSGDLFGPLPQSLRGRVDVLLANAPYVPSAAIATMPREARLHEPMVALDGGHDGTAVQRRIIEQAAQWLAPGGTLLIETATAETARLAHLMQDNGLRPSMADDPESGAAVVLGAR